MSKKEDLKYRKKYNKNKDSTINDAITGVKHGAISGWNMFNIMGRDILAKSDRDLLAIEREERFDKKPDQERIKKLEEYINQKEIEMQPYIQSELANRKSYEEFYNNINNAPSKALTTLAYGGASTLTNPMELAKNIALGKLTIGGVAANFALGTALDTLDNLYANSYEDELLGIERTIDKRAVLEAFGGAVAGNSINLAVDLTKGLGKKVLDPSDYLVGRNSTNSIIKDMVEDVKENSYGSIDIYGDNIFKKDTLTPEILDIPPLDLALKNDSMLKQEAKMDLKNKGYDISVNINAMEKVAKRQEYGEPQFNYAKVTEESIDNYLNSVYKLSKQIQSENNGVLKSNINLKDDATVSFKPLVTNMELNIEQIRARRAEEMFGVRGERFGNELYDRTKNMNPTDFANQIRGEGIIVDQYGDSTLSTYMKRVVDDYARTEEGYSNASHSKKNFLFNHIFEKNIEMENIRKAYETNDVGYILNNVAPFCGRKVELTREEAKAVGLYFHSNKINKTIRKDAGGYEDFKREFDVFKDKLKEKNKADIKDRRNKIKEEVEALTKEYKEKVNKIKKKQTKDIDDIKDDKKLYDPDKLPKARRLERKNNKELRILKEEYEKNIKKIAKKYKDNSYTNFYKKAEKVGKRNYKKFYENFKELENEFKEIKELRDIIKDNGELVETNTYSIFDDPIKVAKALYYDINTTTREAMKDGGVIKYNTPYSVGMKWGNRPETDLITGNEKIEDIEFENFWKLFEGTEREVYEIVTGALNELTKRESGFELLEEFAGNLKIDDRRFSKNSTKNQRFKMQTLDGNTRKYVETQINALREKVGLVNQYKPNMWIDPKDQRLNMSMAKTTVKGFLSAKFLSTLNGIREFTTNNLRITLGARQLGWNKKYSLLKSTFIDPFKVHLDLVKNSINIHNDTIEKITNPIVKRRAELFIERRVENDLVWNNPKNFSTFYKIAQAMQKGVKKVGDNLAVEQLVSDVHRIVNAEWASINYLKDIFPELKDIQSVPVLKKVLETNGLTDGKLLELQTRLKNLTDDELMELVWSGKKADNMVDYKIQSLFEQFADIMGKEFDAFEKIEGGKLPKNFTMDMLMLYKRYSLGAVDNFTKRLLTYYDDEGFIRNRFDSNADFKTNLKNTFKGMNTANILDFSKAAIGTYLLATGISWVHGTISGSTEDERAEAKLKAIFGDGDIFPFIYDAVSDYALDITGIGLFYGGKSVLGGFIDSTSARLNRALSSEKLTTMEAITWWAFATFTTPEFIARGIDNIKFQKNIPSRLTTPSKTMQREWKYKYKRLAEIEQAKGKLPIEKAFGGAINWLQYFKNHEDVAYEITGSDKSMDKNAVIAGAYGITKLAEEFSEAASLQTILNDERPEYKQQQLEILGLDIDSQLSKLSRVEKNTLNTILAFKKMYNEEEILFLLQQLNNSDDKIAFLKSILEPEEMEIFLNYKQNLLNNKTIVNKELKKLKDKKGMEKYLAMLRIIETYSR